MLQSLELCCQGIQLRFSIHNGAVGVVGWRGCDPLILLKVHAEPKATNCSLHTVCRIAVVECPVSCTVDIE